MKKGLKAVKALKEARPQQPSLERLAAEAKVLARKIAGTKREKTTIIGTISAGHKLTATEVEAMLEAVRKPSLRGYTSAERKDMPVQTLMAEYFPDAFMACARHAKKANVKHNGPDAPMHWARGKSTDHLNCAGRHLLTPDAIDPDTGETEAVCLLWRAAAYVQLQEERRLVAAGIKPLSGVIPDGDG